MDIVLVNFVSSGFLFKPLEREVKIVNKAYLEDVAARVRFGCLASGSAVKTMGFFSEEGGMSDITKRFSS